MSMKKEINRAARSLARSNIERCLQCKLFSTPKCKVPYKEEILICKKFVQLSLKNQVVIVGLVEFSRLKGTKSQMPLSSF